MKNDEVPINHDDRCFNLHHDYYINLINQNYMTATAKTDDFYEWFKGAGGNMITNNPEELNKNIHSVPLKHASTLKIDPERIKEKYNHKFKQNENR